MKKMPYILSFRIDDQCNGWMNSLSDSSLHYVSKTAEVFIDGFSGGLNYFSGSEKCLLCR
jgi:hypothetical protein